MTKLAICSADGSVKRRLERIRNWFEETYQCEVTEFVIKAEDDEGNFVALPNEYYSIIHYSTLSDAEFDELLSGNE